MLTSLIKVDEKSLSERMREEHTPQPGDIFIYKYDNSIIRILSQDTNYTHSYYYETWSFAENKWIASINTISVSKEYYMLLLHPFEEILKLSNDCFDNPNLFDNTNQEFDEYSLMTQNDNLNMMLQSNQLLVDKMSSIQLFMKSRIKEIERIMMNKMESLNPIIKSLNKTIHNIKEIVNILNAYLGEGVDVKHICTGEPASENVTLNIRQRILFMDEEVAIINSDGQGLDYKDKDTFYEWLKDKKNRDIVLPEEKCVVVFKPKRFQHKYSNDYYTNTLLNQWNKHSFIMIRNGENIYSIESENLCIYDSVMPTKTKLDEIQNSTWNNKDFVEEQLNSLKFRGLFFCMILQGLIDKTDIFKPSSTNINILKNIGVNFIFDDEVSLGTGIKDFKTWIFEKSKNIKRGSRIIYISGGDYLKYYSNEFSKPKVPEPGLYSVDEYNSKLIIKYLPDDVVWSWTGFNDRKNKISWVFEKTNAINYDEIDISELNNYLNDRTQRKYYVNILPLLLQLKSEKLKEKQWEDAFKNAMTNFFKKEHNITLTDDLICEAIKWWKLKVIFKRPLKQDDEKSWRMIEKYCLNKFNQ